jgi:quinol monooxygenase YgiN
VCTVATFIFIRLHARVGRSSEVRDAVECVLQETRREPGCTSANLFGSVKDNSLFFIHSQWRDEAAFDAHLGTPHTIAFKDKVKPLIDHELDVMRTALIY